MSRNQNNTPRAFLYIDHVEIITTCTHNTVYFI